MSAFLFILGQSTNVTAIYPTPIHKYKYIIIIILFNFNSQLFKVLNKGV